MFQRLITGVPRRLPPPPDQNYVSGFLSAEPKHDLPPVPRGAGVARMTGIAPGLVGELAAPRRREAARVLYGPATLLRVVAPYHLRKLVPEMRVPFPRLHGATALYRSEIARKLSVPVSWTSYTGLCNRSVGQLPEANICSRKSHSLQ